MRSGLVPAVISALLWTASAASQAPAQCKNDSMCKPGDTCSAGRCAPRTAPSAPSSTAQADPALPASEPAAVFQQVAPAPENTAQACSDRLDQDADGFVDCADQDCFVFNFCSQPRTSLAPPPLRAPMVETGETRGITALIIAGPILFGVTYLVTVLIASIAATGSDDDRITNYAAIPLVGPWAMLGSSIDTDNFATPLVLSGVFQATGLVMTVLGLVIRRPVYRREYGQLSSGISLGDSLTLSPSAMGRGGVGLQLRLGAM